AIGSTGGGQSRGATIAGGGAGGVTAFEPQGFQPTTAIENDPIGQDFLQGDAAGQAGAHPIQFLGLPTGQQDGRTAARVGIGQHALEGPTEGSFRCVHRTAATLGRGATEYREAGKLGKTAPCGGYLSGLIEMGGGGSCRQDAGGLEHGPGQTSQQNSRKSHQQES